MKENNNQKTIQKIKAGGNIKIGKSYKPEVELNSTENINEIQNIETEKEVEILEDYVPKMVFKKEELVSSSKFEETKVLTKETGSEEQYQEEIDQKVSEEMVEKTKKLEILNKEEISNVVFSINENIDKIKAWEDHYTNSAYTRNILLIGHTGSGKSTLGNILLSKEGKFKEVFKGSAGRTSKTREVQIEEYERKSKNIKYRIIDTVGINDTKLSEKEVLNKIAEAVYHVRDGLNQILFVTNGKFNRGEVFIYNLLRKVIFDENITKYTTIVRTNFPEFDNEKECSNDHDELLKENKELEEIFSSVKFIHVNNDINSTKHFNNPWKKSREKLLEHLEVHRDEVYKPQNFQELVNRIGNHMREIEELQKEIVKLEKKKKEVQKRLSEGEKRNSSGQELLEAIKILSDNRIKTEENMIKLVETIKKETLQHIEEKGLLVRWLEVIGDTTDKVIEVAQIVTKCKIM